MKWENLTEVLNDFGYRLCRLYQQKLADRDINTTLKTLSNSTYYYVNGDGRKFEVDIELEDYWKYIEKGRKAGSKMPPISAIENWIKIKPVLPRPIDNGRLPSTKQLAFLIARSIGIKGIKPKPILQESLDSVFDEFEQVIEMAIQLDLENEMNLWQI